MAAHADTVPPGNSRLVPPTSRHPGLASVRAYVELFAEKAGEPCSEPDLIAQIAQLESLQHSLAALQSAKILAFARSHAATRTARGTVEPEKLERDIGSQIALACRVSHVEGRKRVRVARDLRDGHDHVAALFAAGQLSAYKVGTIVTATSHLDAAERAEVDRLLTEHPLPRLGVGRIRDAARRLVAQVAPDEFRARTAVARADRRVTLRPAPDGMTDLTAHLPVEQGVACLAALHKAVVEASVSREPMTRGRGQIMADTLVERVTGQAVADQVHLAVQIVVPVEALVDPECPLPAEIPGHGPVPVDLLSTADGRATWRRLVTRAGIVIGGDSSRRTFTGFLAELIRARDGHRCREPYCDAPIRELDHIRRWADGGPTEFGNSRGLCQLHNLLREEGGWQVERTPAGIRTTTPTGHSYLSPALRINRTAGTDPMT